MDFTAIRAQFEANNVLYLDIETTGLDPIDSVMTCAAVFDGTAVHSFVRDENLADLVTFLLEKSDALLCTFNGVNFDVPFIEAETKQRIPHAHADLHILGTDLLGITGGFKAILKRFNLAMSEEQNSGLDAIWLWTEFQRTGDRRYRDALVAYNASDVLGLHSLLPHLYNTWAEQQGIAEALPVPMHVQLDSSDLLSEVTRHRKAYFTVQERDHPYFAFTDPQRLDRARHIKGGDLHGYQTSGKTISATITGSQGNAYELLVKREGDVIRVKCSCPDFLKNADADQLERKFCKHLIKLLQVTDKTIVKEIFSENGTVEYKFT